MSIKEIINSYSKFTDSVITDISLELSDKVITVQVKLPSDRFVSLIFTKVSSWRVIGNTVFPNWELNIEEDGPLKRFLFRPLYSEAGELMIEAGHLEVKEEAAVSL